MADDPLISALKDATGRAGAAFATLITTLEERDGVPLTKHERELLGTAFGRGMEFAQAERKILDDMETP